MQIEEEAGTMPIEHGQLSETLLMGPGPSCVPPAVYQALAWPTIGHLDPRFLEIMEEIQGCCGR